MARAVTSPSAILAAGAGAALGVLLSGGLAVPAGAVIGGVLAYGARVLAAVPRKSPKGSTPPSPRTLSQPWRRAMEQVLDARRRFDEATSTLEAGPLLERLHTVADRLDTAVAEAWRIAQAGHILSEGRARIDTNEITSELATAQQSPESTYRPETIAALEAQLGSAARIDATIADAQDRLRLLDARTDEAVTRAVELSVSQADPDAVGDLDSEVSSIVDDLEALRLAIEETDDPSPDDPSPDDLRTGEPIPGTQDGQGGTA